MGQRRKLDDAKATETRAKDTDEDIISNLPNVLCTHILSFVSTKDAVRTSVLSSRWKCLWTSVPILDLRDWNFGVEDDRGIDLNRAKAKFIIFVHQFLMRANQFSVRKIHLWCYMPYDLSVIESWIFLAIELKVQRIEISAGFYEFSEDSLPSMDTRVSLLVSRSELGPLGHYGTYTGEMELVLSDASSFSVIESWVHLADEFNIRKLRLEISGFQEQELPQALFLWKSLEVLRVYGHAFLNFPVPSVSFPKLKALTLSETYYRDDVWTSNLISSLPLLEELTMNRYEGDNLFCLTITSHTLKRLEVYFPDKSIYVVPRRETRINAPGLQYLTLHDNVTQHYFLEDLCAVVEANFDVWNNSELPDSTQSGAFELLRKTRNVECLTLSNATVMVLQEYDLMTFHRLTHFEINGEGGLDKEDICWELFLQFLRSSPKLESLILEAIPYGLDEEFDATSEQDPPDCLESQLKLIEIGGLSCKEDELKLIGYFLRNSKILKRLSVGFSYSCMESSVKKDFREAILALPKCSTECQIQIS